MATVNKTFRLHEDVVEYLAERVRSGDAPSQTALLESLVRREKERREREEFRRRRRDAELRARQEVGGVALDANLLEGLVGLVQDRAAGRLVDAARFHADEAVLDQVQPADPAYVAEIEQIEREFEPLDVEAWKMVDMGDPDPEYSDGRS